MKTKKNQQFYSELPESIKDFVWLNNNYPNVTFGEFIDILRNRDTEIAKAKELLEIALEELTCDSERDWKEPDDFRESHFCNRCHELIDRNAPVRKMVREFLGGKYAQQSDGT